MSWADAFMDDYNSWVEEQDAQLRQSQAASVVKLPMGAQPLLSKRIGIV